MVLAGALAGCSSSSGSTSAGSASSVSAIASTSSAAARSTSASVVGIDLPQQWVSRELAETGAGYGMNLTSTSEPDLYDGHFFHRQSDGAVSNQQVITVRVVGEDAVEIRWPGGEVVGGFLAFDPADSDHTEIDLSAGCGAYLDEDGGESDCVLFPADRAPAASTRPSPGVVRDVDQAMGYLCSVSITELANIVDSSSDPYSTSILQAALTTLGYEPGPIDGRYGRASKEAVRNFQSAAGIGVDGLVGPQTWSRLQTAACKLVEDPAAPTEPAD